MDIERLPPHSIEAEEAVLGSLLIDPDALFEVSTFLRPEFFYREQNKWIYQAILDLHDRREPVDLITLTEELRRREQLEELGGEAYVIGLINIVPTSINAKHYGRIVEATALRRRLIAAATQIATFAYDENEDVNVVIDRAEQTLFSVSEERVTRDLTPVKQIAKSYLERIEELNARGQEIIGVPTGFTDMDRMLGGLNKSDLIIVAARPGMGKCVTADTKLVDPRTGQLTDIETLVQRQQAHLLTLNADYRLVASQASHFVDSGIKPVYRVTTGLGREIKTTFSHPFLTIQGWRPLYDLKVGDRVAVPRVMPVFGTYSAPEHEAKVLAYLLADGSLVGRSPQFTNANPCLLEDFSAAASQFPGNKIRLNSLSGQRTPTLVVTQDEQYKDDERFQFAGRLKTVWQASGLTRAALAERLQVSPSAVKGWLSGDIFPSAPNFAGLCQVLQVSETTLLPHGHAQSSQIVNTLTHWLKQMGVWGKNAAAKEIPAIVYTYTRPRLALFLNRLFACDGSIYLQNKTQPVVSYSSVSEALIKGVNHLLLRFGIIAKLRRRQVKYQGNYRPAFELRITDSASIQTFIQEIGAFGKEAIIAAVETRCAAANRNTNQDTIPLEVWNLVGQAKGEQSWATVYDKMGLARSHNLHVGQRAPSRGRMEAIAQALASPSLIHLAQSDVYWDAIVAIEPLGEQQVYDLTVPDTHNFVADDMIVHNTSLQMSMTMTAAMKHQKRIAVFSLEMSGEQLLQRMIAIETRIDSQRLRRGNLYDQEWPIFYEAIGRLSEAHIFIDDTPGITPMQLRTKCRRLYAEHGIDMVLIDYLQLMQTDFTTNNRVQEISEISRSLKGLARELDVPVIAAAQLSRAVEQRQDKRPMLSDLRDSGCLTGDTLIPLADSGKRVPLRDLIGQANFAIWALNPETYQIERAIVSDAFATGTKPVFRLKTALGRSIRATANHKFLTIEGWRRLDELKVGTHLALPRHVPTPASAPTLANAELALLGHLIGDGCTLPRHAIQYTTREEDLAQQVAALTQQCFGADIAPRIKKERTWFQVYLTSARHHTHGIRNPISEWLDELGVWGLRSHEKRVPAQLFQQPVEGIALFLRHLWATDGCVRMTWGKSPRPAVYYASSSPQLAQDVQSLLLRLGINARLTVVGQARKGRPQYHVTITGQSDIMRFGATIGTVGHYKTASWLEIQNYLQGRGENTNRDVLPKEIWSLHVRPAMEASGMSHRHLHSAIGTAYSGMTTFSQNVSRERASRVAAATQSPALQALAQSDVYWDQIISIEADGVEPVYDLTVPGPHNFIANDIIAHNSIEQDADIVMFIYRDDYYYPETSERKNIAEINVAKHRNGPTGSVDLFWHGELATFRNLQRQEVQL